MKNKKPKELMKELQVLIPGVEWTAETVWAHVATMLKVYEETKHLGAGVKPIVYIHNHDFNGEGGHIGKELLKLAQKNGYLF